MEILAIIPARAGSKAIPNKNIRIIAGKPMIFYAINNALKSKFIDHVIVTTDSSDIKTIAEQMGVTVHWRNSDLCQDNITLDAVVYDAIPELNKWDLIVTLQPTSPLLEVDTLDSAIQYYLDNEADTVISVVNKPHLAWSIVNEKLTPNYKERLNRQYLPPYYQETGAFLISNSSVINPTSRFGEKIDIYEVPADESLDIDTFEDLIIANHLIEHQRIGIYVNGNNERGLGHVYRALEIADEFNSKPDILFDKNQTDIRIFGNTTHNLVPVNGIVELFELCKRKKYNVFINDILDTSVDYMIGLRTVLGEARIINFEDCGEGKNHANVVINALFEREESSKEYCGYRYFIASKKFLFYNPIKINKQVKSVLITFGGSDPQDYTSRLLDIIKNSKYSKYKFTVVIGKAYKNTRKIKESVLPENISILYSTNNMPSLMAESDIAITSRGRTAYELALMGVPTIAIAQNSREEKHTFVSRENGFTYLGKNPSDEIITGTLQMYLEFGEETRRELQLQLLKNELRDGRKRVMNIIQEK